MIVVKLIGGLGNQMFQYAAGRRLSYVNSSELKLDISGYEHQDAFATKREYLLSIFTLNAEFASPRDINSFKSGPFPLIRNFIPRSVSRFLPVNKSFISERTLDFNQEVLNLKGNIYLEGYWQSEKYFKDITEIIRRDFTIKSKPDKENSEILKRITGDNAVSLHVRRGDYVSDKATTKFHGICDIVYYRKAIRILADKIKKPKLYIFSDEPEWVKKNMKFDLPAVYVTNNAGKKDYEDMRLMSACKHNIIVNSSFSWWGAWLNSNPEKIVIAPKVWFAAQKVRVADRIPRGWETL